MLQQDRRRGFSSRHQFAAQCPVDARCPDGPQLVRFTVLYFSWPGKFVQVVTLTCTARPCNYLDVPPNSNSPPMRIVVIGAGTVGTSIAEMLCHEKHSVTVVDQNPRRTRAVNERLDVRVVTGSGAQSSVLFQADVLGCDLCLAVTGIDEVNLIAASLAREMGAQRTVARVYSTIYRDASTFDYRRHFQIDRLLSLEHLSAMEFARELRSPGSIAVENFARGELEVHEVEITARSRKLDIPLRELAMPRTVRIGSISREGRTWIAGADDRLAAGDHVTLIGKRNDVDDVKDSLRTQPPPRQGVVIVGGGETGYQLARMLEGPHFALILLEVDLERCEFLAKNLHHTTVVHCDGTRRRVLEEERVGSADAFVACTGDDENNILAAVEARDIGVQRVMAIVGRPDYAAVMGRLAIDRAVSPRQVMAKQVVGMLHSGPVVSRSPLGRGEIVILEVEVREGSPATEHVLANLDLPGQCLIAAVTREDFVRVPGADDRLKSGDTVIVLVEESVVDAAVRVFGSHAS